jgi:primosomal protein N' (replication factor Y)
MISFYKMSPEAKDTRRLYAEIAIPLPVEKTFHYAIPPELRSICDVGKRVLVPLGKRKVTGYVLEIVQHLPPGIGDKDIKEIIDCLDQEPLFDAGMLAFFRWTAAYYLAPLGQVIKTALPPGINWESSYHVSLTPEGKQAVCEQSPGPSPFVTILHGIDPQKGTPLKRLLQDHPYRSSFLSLQRKGLISLEARIRPGRTTTKTRAVADIIRTPAPADALTHREQEIVSFLNEQGTMPLMQIRKRFKRASATLAGLQAKGVVGVREEEVAREPALWTIERTEGPFVLTAEQRQAVEQINQALKQDTFRPFLLYGVTGSGKTEVYLRAVEEALALGKRAIILVPEISLTPQLVGRFQGRLGVEMALLHSGLAPGERYDQWRKAHRGEARVIIGARSAIFVPCTDLGLIIVDEEHETSYKQEEGVRYNARDLAIVRAQRAKAVMVLGSATPSLESFYNAERGKFHLLCLPSRVGGGILPTVEVVDLKQDKYAVLSPPLHHALGENLKRGEQSLLFLNRRGFSHSAICAECGSAFKCHHCSVTLTYHARAKILLCHYCGYQLPALPICPHCRGGRIHLLGFGTERVEREVTHLFPQARVARMDSDVMTQRGAHGRLLQALERREIDILVGTQMIVKGHDFPHITLVGIIAADVSINLPELRAAERGFQLLSQAAGRAGRGSNPGRVIVQTALPEHYVLQKAKDHDFVGFYQAEMAFRTALRYPPLTRMVNVRVSAGQPKAAEEGMRQLARKGEQWLPALHGEVEMMGPSPAPLYQIKGRYRWQLLLKGEKVSSLQRLSRALLQEGKALKGITVEVDVDPVSML